MLGTYQLDLDYYNCRDDLRLYTSPEIANRICNLVSEAGFQKCGEICYLFPNSEGFTLAVIIAESHVVVSTWPEYRYVQISISTCHYTKNNSPKARALKRSLSRLYRPKIVVDVKNPRKRGPLKKYLKFYLDSLFLK